MQAQHPRLPIHQCCPSPMYGMTRATVCWKASRNGGQMHVLAMPPTRACLSSNTVNVVFLETSISRTPYEAPHRHPHAWPLIRRLPRLPTAFARCSLQKLVDAAHHPWCGRSRKLGRVIAEQRRDRTYSYPDTASLLPEPGEPESPG